MIGSGNQTALWILAIALAVYFVYLLFVARRRPAAPPATEEVEDYNWITTTDRAQLQDESDGGDLPWRRAQGFEPTYPADDYRPRLRAGSNPFQQPADERRRP